jgi:hypothetical protein
VWGRGGGGLGEVMMKRRSKRGSGVLISSDRVRERLCLGLQNTRRCSGVAKRCLQSIGRKATLILGSVDVFWLPHMACLDPRSLLHNQGHCYNSIQPCLSMVKARQQWIVVEEARLTIVRDQRGPTQEPRFVPVPDCQETP